MTWLNRLVRSDSPKYQRPLKTLAGYLMQRTGRFEHLEIQRDGYVLPFYATSNVALTCWVVPDLVDATEAFVSAVLRPDAVFVDVGANVGTVSALAAGLVGPSGRVLAIEPHPATFGLLKRTIAANGLVNVICVEAACGSAPGTALLTDVGRKDDNNRVEARGDRDGIATGMTVRSTRLDDLLDEHDLDRIDLVKIDVEGFEGAVLRGLDTAFSRIDAFHVEVIEANLQRYGDTASSIITLLQGHGFTCFEITGDPTNLVALSDAARAASSGVGLVEIPEPYDRSK